MTIDIDVSQQAIQHVSVRSSDVVHGKHMTSAWLGIDLSMLGVQSFVNPLVPEKEPFHYPKMMAATRAAANGGLDFVALSAEFCADGMRPHATLDAVNVAAQLRGVEGAGIIAEVLAEPTLIRQAIDTFAVDGAGWASLAVRIPPVIDSEQLIAAFREIELAGIGLVVNVKSTDLTSDIVRAVAKYANMVRLQVPDPHVARGLRYKIRAMANSVGRDVPIVVDLGVVISATSSAANERALLVSAINGEELFSDIPKICGTVYDVADAIERWVGLGAADGVVVHPASLPTDLASLIRGVVPLLSGRAGVEVKQQSLV
ncbi:hypothetical protein [Arcanobacterium phocae]|uniref:hypothetical protein n=1 Tax=Arcanobacterium phocae TaxID=131112 RepID=UPI001C0EDD47|nr:hypothetical protein [Arcanobacterium phocae]